MRVLHIITGLAAGGAEQQLRLLVSHLPVESTVVTLTNPGVVADAIEAAGVRVIDLGMAGNRDLTALGRLTRLVRAGRYDLVHTHLYRASVYGRLAARFGGVRHVVTTEHSLGDSRMEGRRLSAGVRGLYLATERLGNATIAVSGTVARRLVGWGVPPPRIAVIPNGLAEGEFRYDPGLRSGVRAAFGLGSGQVVVGAVGRLEQGKRLDVLVRAVAGLDDVILLVVGTGSQRRALEELARGCGIADRVRFAGERRDVRPLLCAMDVLATASEEETFGLAVLEGLACGLPVLYVTCPALDDLPPTAAPGARRVPLDVMRLRDELTAATPAVDGREPPAAVQYYSIDRLAADVARLYGRVRAGRPASPGPAGRQTPYGLMR
jgi:glycosyltransferase involved in cell wall biosynthesis